MATALELQLWRSGYRALPEERGRRNDPDVFEARLLGRRAVVVRGPDGARLFYDTSVVEREGAVPAPIARLLFGRGAVHGLDDEEHAARKGLFLEVLRDERTRPLAEAIGRDLGRRTEAWPGRKVVVFDELVEVYGAAVLAWAGIAVDASRARRTSHRLAAIVDGFGGQGLAYPRGWAARLSCSRWARELVERVRAGVTSAPEGSPLEALATGPGRDLDAGLAGVELLNILRPTVAVAWPGTFAALALVEHPQWRPLLGGDRTDDRLGQRRVAFAQEVRRTCPFVPALAGRVRAPAEIAGTRLEPGDMIVLDVPATNHDPHAWAEPGEFLPERFAETEPDPYELVAQGGGPAIGHRCPGEPLTVAILTATVGVLAGVDYEVASAPTYDATRIPTLPARGLVVRTRPTGANG